MNTILLNINAHAYELNHLLPLFYGKEYFFRDYLLWPSWAFKERFQVPWHVGPTNPLEDPLNPLEGPKSPLEGP